MNDSLFPWKALAITSSLVFAACSPSEPQPTAASSAKASASAPTISAAQQLPDQTLSALRALPVRTVCSVEAIASIPGGSPQPAVNNTYAATPDGNVKLIGFATDVDKGEPLSRFTLLLAGDQVYGVQAAAGLERPDVAQYFKKPGLLMSGFQADFSLKGVPTGEYSIMLRADEGVICPTHQKLKIG